MFLFCGVWRDYGGSAEIYNFDVKFVFILLRLKNYEFYYATPIFRDGSKALFGWAFGFGFWPQKPKAQPKGLLLEGAFSEAAAFS